MMVKNPRHAVVNKKNPVSDIVSDDESVMSLSRDTLEDQVAALTQLVTTLSIRLRAFEGSTKSQLRKRPTRDGTGISSCRDVSQKYILFSKGDSNPKGGVHEFHHLEQVYLSDENKEGIVHDETRVYAWVLVDGEIGTRRKVKSKLKRLRR